MRKNTIGIGVFLLLALLVAACGPAPTPAPYRAAVLPTRVPPTDGPSPTPLVTATFTPTVTLTPSQTATPTLTLTPSETPIPATATPAPPARLSYGDVVTGAISNDVPGVTYLFMGQQGDRITIQMNRLHPADTLDAYLTLLDGEGGRLAFNDDAPEPDSDITTNARIGGFRLPYSGEYAIVATRFQAERGDTEGDFELALLVEESPPEPVLEELPIPAQLENSGSIGEDGRVYGELFPGDDIRGMAYQAFVTFELPEDLDPDTVQQAVLVIDECDVHGDPFEQMGPVLVELAAYDALDPGDFAALDRDMVRGEIGGCPLDGLDVTDGVRQAMAEQPGRVQLRLAFDGVDNDRAIDDVTFGVPLLVLLVELPPEDAP